MKISKIFSGLLLALALVMTLQTDKAYAYTIEDMGDYIENPEWLDHQSGNYMNILHEKGLPVPEYTPQVSSSSVYLDKNVKSYQIYIRQYCEDKGIDIDETDFTWTSYDERICTVSNGLVKAGDMTGVTTLVAENKEFVIGFTVVNQTGKYDDWYEEMFTDLYDEVKFMGQPQKISEFDGAASARETVTYLGEAYKLAVDAYLKHGNSLYSDTDTRLKVIKETVNKVISAGHVRLKGGTKTWGDCNHTAYYTERILTLFRDENRTQKCASGTDGPTNHVTNYLLLDGTIWNVDNGNFSKIGVESDGKWKTSKSGAKLLYFDDNEVFNLKDVIVQASKSDSFKQDRNAVESAFTY